MVGVGYSQSWDMKTPTTLLDAALGDSSIVTVDTLGSTIYIGDWPVDSVVTIDVYDIPPGLIVECSTPGCRNIFGPPHLLAYQCDLWPSILLQPRVGFVAPEAMGSQILGSTTVSRPSNTSTGSGPRIPSLVITTNQ